MAWLFGLVAECGNHHLLAEDFCSHFQNFDIQFSNGLITTCSNRIWKDDEENWWALIEPKSIRVDADGDPDLTDKKYSSEAGFQLYEYLRLAPAFRFAKVGWEAEGFVTFSELNIADIENISSDGMVISNEIWQALDCPRDFEVFSQSHHWNPYTGEWWSP